MHHLDWLWGKLFLPLLASCFLSYRLISIASSFDMIFVARRLTAHLGVEWTRRYGSRFAVNVVAMCFTD